MAKIEIKINYVAEWTDKSARVLVLQTKDETISFPVIIAESEAFSIVKELENLQLKRPQTHDLLYSIMRDFQINVDYVHIYNLVEGIFYTHLHCSNMTEEIKIEARISDAAILALKYKCPMYIEDFILEQVGVNADSNQVEDLGSADDLSRKSVKELETILQEAIENENYEYASQIRDEINRKSKL